MTLDTITDDARDDVEQFLLAIADDEFVTGNRLGRWVGSGPTLEEDNALSAILQDEIGHARLWYEVVADHRDHSVTRVAHERPAEERHNSVLVEADHEDFADTVVRSFLYDRAERRLVEAVRDGDVDELSDRAAVVLNEEPYHHEHAEQWLNVLSATEEGRGKLEAAFEANLPRARDYFAFEDDLAASVRAAGAVDRSFDDMEAAWIDDVASHVETLPVDVDVAALRETLAAPPEINGRAGEHTDTMTALVEDLYPTREEMYPDDIDEDGDLKYEEKVGLL